MVAQSKVESLFVENELLKKKVSSLSNEVEKTQDHLKALEKDVNTQKAFSKLKHKQIDDALLKIQKVDPEAVEKFKNSDEYSDKLCNYYMEGFDLFHKYMVKNHPDLDLSTLDMEVVEKEFLADCQFVEAVGRGEDVVATDEALVDPSSYNPIQKILTFLFLIFEKQSSGLVCFVQIYFLSLNSLGSIVFQRAYIFCFSNTLFPCFFPRV